jgi:hypothetical protein
MEKGILLTNLVGESKVNSMIAKMRKPGGRLVGGIEADVVSPTIDRQFGQFGERVLFVSRGTEKLDTEQTTALGGWCALRTEDVSRMQQGRLTDPATGEVRRYTSVPEVADWITRAISIDQCIEAIGIYTGNNYAAISEEQLWGDRVKGIVANQFGRALTAAEAAQVEGAMQAAELRRYEYTKRYITLVSGQEPNLKRVVDGEISGDLQQVRDEMLDTAGISMEKLKGQFPNDLSIDNYSLVWGMYTGPYLTMLRNRGYVQTPKGLLVEPWMHAVSETEAKTEVNDRFFGNRANDYLVAGGINQDLGFAAYSDVMLPNGDRMRSSLPISAVPNQENYSAFVQALAEEPGCGSLDLAANPAYVWGVNLFPYGNTKNALYRMIDIKRDYKEMRSAIKKNGQSRQDMQQTMALMKKTFEGDMQDQAIEVILGINSMLQTVFA